MKYSLLGCVLVLLPVPAISQYYGMPRGSFLLMPARSTVALLREYDNYPEVRRRYMDIFGRSKEETREILARLRPKELTESHEFPVGYYSQSGKWMYRERTLPKGTMVFVTPEGKPFLKEECGNPLIVSVPYPTGKASVSRPPIKLPESLARPPIPVVVGPQPSPETLAPPGSLPAITTLPTPELAELYRPEGATEAVPELSPGVLEQPGPGHEANFSWLALLLPFLFLFGGHHNTPPECCAPPVVPESSSWMLMGAGALGLGMIALLGRKARSS